MASAIAWENYRARFDHAFGIEPGGFSADPIMTVCCLAEVNAYAHGSRIFLRLAQGSSLC